MAHRRDHILAHAEVGNRLIWIEGGEDMLDAARRRLYDGVVTLLEPTIATGKRLMSGNL